MTAATSRDAGPGRSGEPYARQGQPSEQDRRILALLAEGFTTVEAANHLGYQPNNVARRIRTLADQNGFTTLEQLYLYAGQQGWCGTVRPFGRSGGSG